MLQSHAPFAHAFARVIERHDRRMKKACLFCHGLVIFEEELLKIERHKGAGQRNGSIGARTGGNAREECQGKRSGVVISRRYDQGLDHSRESKTQN
ncbi:MAG TPA: hypothetical protein VFN35_05730 [Ktedonobacteraceae bacterium]|nr:hypothetical protein [Ktedonobacteraceae bacterium]